MVEIIFVIVVLGLFYYLSNTVAKRKDRIHIIIKEVAILFLKVKTNKDYWDACSKLSSYRKELESMGFDSIRFYWDLDTIKDACFNKLTEK